MTAVVLDARSLADSSCFRGIGTYVRHLLAGLANQAALEVAALVPAGTDLPAGVRPVVVRRVAPGRWADAEHDLLLAYDLRRAGGDVVHSPGQDSPRRCRPPWVQTLHGVAPLVLDSPELAVERRRWARRAPRLARASAFVAVSAWCAEQAADLLDLDPDLVHVVHHGVDPAFGADGPGARPQPDPPYLAYVGEFGPTKGYVEAFEVVAALARAGHPHRLQVAGRVAPWVAGPLADLVARASRPDLVDLVGHLDHSGELPAFYRGASALVVTSRYESFCLPAVEAMASGTPVVAFDNTALPEVLGGAGLLVPDGDVAAFADAVGTLLDSSASQAEMAARGRERARAFDWASCAAAHARIYADLDPARPG